MNENNQNLQGSERYEKGLNNLKRIDGESGENVVNSLGDIAPDVSKYIIEFAFGDIYSRGCLNNYQRELITLAALLTTGGCDRQLEVHINGALNVGVTKDAIIEVFIQCIPYTGFPKVLNAIYTAKEVFNKNAGAFT